MRMNSVTALGPALRPQAVPRSSDGYPRNVDIMLPLSKAIESYKEMADHGGRLGIKVTIENHWGLAADPINIRIILDEVNHPYCEASPDFCNWEYEYMLVSGLKAVAPYAHTNVHAKYWDRWGEYNDVRRSTKIMLAAGFKGTFAEFNAFLYKDKQFFFTRPEDRLRAYRDIAKRADAELPKLFAELPRMPYGIRAMEEFEGDNSDYYSGPALDGSRAGFFSANVNKLENRPSWEMEATLLHEAVPGHHLQIARAMELGELPRFRRAGGFTAYSEGWALYAESLGFEMGFYKDPYQHFGRLVLEMLRAVRLVIDTGVHAKGWTRQQAIDYGIEPSEVDRYVVNPGQACAYMIGQLELIRLRDVAKNTLKDRFSGRAARKVIHSPLGK